MSNLHTNDVPMENDDADSTASGPLSGPMPDIICPCNDCTKKRQAAKLALAAAKGKGHGKGSGSGEPEAAHLQAQWPPQSTALRMKKSVRMA